MQESVMSTIRDCRAVAIPVVHGRSLPSGTCCPTHPITGPGRHLLIDDDPEHWVFRCHKPGGRCAAVRRAPVEDTP
jgi:hypothetical protein